MKLNKQNLEFDEGAFPERITLELTNSCNLNCVFCPRRLMAKRRGFLGINLAKKLIDESAGHLPVSIVPFFRGEPLLHPKWEKILSYIKKRGVGPIQLTTNATLLDYHAAHLLIDLEIDFISFSLDTLDAIKYEKARRGAKYANVINNIMTLIELKKSSGSKFPEIQISAIDIPEYSAEMDNFVQYWLPKVDRVRVYIEHSRDGHPGSIAQNLPEFDKRLPCRKVFTDMVVLWDGEIALCNHDWTREKDQQIGNVSNQSIASIWQSERYSNIRERHKAGNVGKESLCEHCDHWKMYYLPEGYLGRLYKKDR